MLNFYKRKTGNIKSCFLLVDGVLEEGPGTEMGMLLGRAVGVFVSLPKTNSVLRAVISSGFLLISINMQDNTEKMKHYPLLNGTLSQRFFLCIFTYVNLNYSVINFTTLLLLSLSFEGPEAPH